jgi:hypothetical protein
MTMKGDRNDESCTKMIRVWSVVKKGKMRKHITVVIHVKVGDQPVQGFKGVLSDPPLYHFEGYHFEGVFEFCPLPTP